MITRFTDYVCHDIDCLIKFIRKYYFHLLELDQGMGKG